MSVPRWLGTRRMVVIGLLTTGAALAIAWSHRQTYAGFLAQFETALPQSAALSADALHDWATLRASHAEVVAALSDTTRTSPAALRRVRDAGGYVDVRVVDSLAHRVGERAETPARMRLGATHDSLSLVDFVAPLATLGIRRRWAVLSSVLNEDALPHFNVAAPSDRTQRTALFWVDGDTVKLLVASAPGGARSASSVPARPDVTPASIDGSPRLDSLYLAHIRRSAETPSHGIGRGLYGQQVVYARVPVPGTPWVLVRERDVDELTELIRPSVYLTDAIFAALAALTIGVVLAWWRSAFLRRETESMQLRSTFVSSVSHELRTPLTQIRMYAEMLRLGLLRDADESTRALRVIEKESERLSLLVDRSLHFLRSGQYPAPDPTATVLVPSALQDAVAAMLPLAIERSQSITWTCEPDVHAHMAPDPLHQVLLNLLDNAIKYGPRGQTIRVAAHRDGSRVRIDIDDEGVGVPADEREQIWEAFARGRHAQAAAESGTGIGLAVVRDLVQQAHGRVWVGARDAGQPGSQFVVELAARPLQPLS